MRIAYRSDLGKCNIQFAKEVFEQVQNRGECTAVALDIKGYFDNIDHITLKEKWKAIIGSELLKNNLEFSRTLTRYSYVSKNNLLKKFNGPKKRNDKIPAPLLKFYPAKRILKNTKLSGIAKLIVTNDKPDSKSKRFKGIPQGSAFKCITIQYLFN